jgi:hypothetical protein
MTRRSALLAGLGLPLGAIPFPAGAFSPKDFWNERKPEAWSSAEVKELLTKSPWAKEAAIVDNGQIGGMGNPRAAAVNRRGGRAGAGAAGGPEGNSPSEKIKWKAVVRWESALPIRETLKKAAPSSKPIKDVEEFYVLNVIGNIPGAIPNSDDGQGSASVQYLKEVTKLEHKGDLVHLSRVELVAENEVSPAGTLFYFSRMLALMPSDKEALFTTKIGPLDVKCTFTLKDMLYRGALEL